VKSVKNSILEEKSQKNAPFSDVCQKQALFSFINSAFLAPKPLYRLKRIFQKSRRNI